MLSPCSASLKGENVGTFGKKSCCLEKDRDAIPVHTDRAAPSRENLSAASRSTLRRRDPESFNALPLRYLTHRRRERGQTNAAQRRDVVFFSSLLLSLSELTVLLPANKTTSSFGFAFSYARCPPFEVRQSRARFLKRPGSCDTRAGNYKCGPRQELRNKNVCGSSIVSRHIRFLK